MPEISVIVPVYNSEKYLRRCIDSILAQTFQEFELILVDNGSTDGSAAMCDEYVKLDRRIQALHLANIGVSAARNAGLDIASGKYIMFADSDDYVDPEWCASLYDVICKDPLAWISCNTKNVRIDGTVVNNSFGNSGGEAYRVAFYELYTASLSGSVWNKIYRRDLIADNQLRFNTQYIIGEDVDFNMRYYALCRNLLFLDRNLYYYCQNEGSAINKYRFNSFDLYRHTFFDRLPSVENEYVGEYLDNWLYRFLMMLNDALDPRSPLSTLQKFRYCNQMLHTEEFRYCADHASGKNESPLFMKIVRTHNFYLYWLFRKAARLKGTVLRKK